MKYLIFENTADNTIEKTIIDELSFNEVKNKCSKFNKCSTNNLEIPDLLADTMYDKTNVILDKKYLVYYHRCSADIRKNCQYIRQSKQIGYVYITNERSD